VIGALAGAASDLPNARAAAQLVETLLSAGEAEANARVAVGSLALLAAADALRGSAPDIAALFARTRLGGRRDAMLGTSDLSAAETRAVLERALPG
jgi:hypothetical protein